MSREVSLYEYVVAGEKDAKKTWRHCCDGIEMAYAAVRLGGNRLAILDALEITDDRDRGKVLQQEDDGVAAANLHHILESVASWIYRQEYGRGRSSVFYDSYYDGRDGDAIGQSWGMDAQRDQLRKWSKSIRKTVPWVEVEKLARERRRLDRQP